MINNLSLNLKQLMSERGLTSTGLARKTGIGQPVIFRLINGETTNPQILTIKPIADFFEISIDQLLGFAPLQKPKPLNNIFFHNIRNKIITIKTIGMVINEILPGLINGYEKAAAAQIINPDISADILPLLNINSSNLIKAAESINEILTNAENPLEK